MRSVFLFEHGGKCQAVFDSQSTFLPVQPNLWPPLFHVFPNRAVTNDLCGMGSFSRHRENWMKPRCLLFGTLGDLSLRKPG